LLLVAVRAGDDVSALVAERALVVVDVSVLEGVSRIVRVPMMLLVAVGAVVGVLCLVVERALVAVVVTT
jgi:hypothetical protein